MITVADLSAISGRRLRGKIAKDIADAVNRHAGVHDIDTPSRLALFLAHASVETGGFTRLDENLNYSAKRLRQVWPSRFKTDAQARKYAKNPRALANYVYGSRLGNKGRADAGWLYRGSGLGQTTGFDNFAVVERETGMPVTKNPDLLRQADSGTLAMCVLWKKWGMNRYADKGSSGVRPSRKRWNGGYHGLSDVQAAYRRGMKRNLSIGGSVASNPKPKADAVLKRGAKGEYVLDLQKNLTALGYGPLVADGDFGKATEAAVKAFQADHGLTVDGWAGNRTQAAIGKALEAPKVREAEKKAETAETKQKPAEPQKPVAGGKGAAVLVAALLTALWAFWEQIKDIIGGLF